MLYLALKGADDADAVIPEDNGVAEGKLIPVVECRSQGGGNTDFGEKLLKPADQDLRLGELVPLQPLPENFVDL